MKRAGLLDGYERERRPVGMRNRDAAGWAARRGCRHGDGSSSRMFATTLLKALIDHYVIVLCAQQLVQELRRENSE
jgi:hypothetical protein